MGKLSQFKERAKELFNEGLGSSRASDQIIEENNLNPIEYRNLAREIRKWTARGGWRKPDQFSQDMEEAKFPANLEFSHGWLKTDKASIFIKNKTEVITFDEMREDFINEMKQHSPKFEKIKRPKYEDKHLMVLDIADLHIGKLASEIETGDNYNSDIAYERAKEGVRGILAKANGFNLEKILFIIGNDVLHVDNAHKTTTSGTPQDVSKMWHENYILARDLYIGIINALVSFADVHIVHNPSNHDYVSGFMLADSVYCWFRNHKNITFDVNIRHRKYFKYGNNLIGTSHGDGAKMDQMPLLMANEAPQEWSETKYRYVYLHHIHHKQTYKFKSGQDFQGVTVEYLRSPSGTDSWHYRNGYCAQKKAIEAFIHHYDDGQVARITHLF